MTNNEEEFETLYDRYYDRVVAYIASLGLLREDARELAQETFIRVYRSMEQGQYRREAQWAFLQKTARNLTLNHFRDRAAKKREANLAFASEDELGNVAADHPSPERAAILHEALERALAAMDNLSENDRECMRWHLAGYKYREIAQVLTISEAKVKSRIHEARRRLKEQGIELPWPNNQSGTSSANE
jgi:RNA polymerase sigma factor (sigma-70 family)